MPRRPVPQRRVIFIGVEGPSERAFVQWLRSICDEAGLHIHLLVNTGSGGDSLNVVEEAARRLGKLSGRREIKGRLVLLDADRIVQDLNAGRDAVAAARRYELRIVLLTPNLEGLLLRLHPGREQTKPQAQSTERELRRYWPDYRKPPELRQLKRRFRLRDLRRAAEHDEHIRTLLRILDL